MNVKEEEESTEEEEEEMVVQYMDSDEEKEKNKEIVEVKRTEEVEKEKEEVEEKEYTFPPIEEWIPAEKAEHFTFLNFRPVLLPSSGDAPSGKQVRSTIMGKFGRSVIIGPSPRVLQWEDRHSSNTMMMVSPDQLRAYLHRKARKFNNQGRVTDLGLGYELQAAVTPWIGNLLIPAKPRLTTADVLRERGEKTQMSSTPFFLLFLQTMNVDTVGCKKMIEQRRNKVVFLTPPPDPFSVQKKNPQTVAGMLQQRRAMKEGLQEVDKQVLKQLHELQHKEKQKQQQLLLKQQVGPQQLLLIQQPQPLPPQISPVSFAQAVVIHHPVLQSQQPAQNTSSLSPHRPPAGGFVTPLIPATSTPHRLIGPPASMTPTSSSLFCQQDTPLIQSLKAELPPHTTGSILPSTSSIPAPCPSQLCLSPSSANSMLNPPRGRGQMDADACISQKGVDFDGAKKRAQQEASEAEVNEMEE